MPTPGDAFQISAAFNMPDSSLAFNVYTAELQAFSGSDWEDVGDEVELFLDQLYADMISVTSDKVSSASFTISLRDKVLSTWNQVHERPWTGFVGTNPSEPVANQNSPHLNAFTELVRHRGGKYLLPVGSSETNSGLYSTSVTNALALFAIDYIQTYSGVTATWLNGIITLDTNQFRRFLGIATFDNIPSAQQSRKSGRGI